MAIRATVNITDVAESSSKTRKKIAFNLPVKSEISRNPVVFDCIFFGLRIFCFYAVIVLRKISVVEFSMEDEPVAWGIDAG